MRIKNKGYTLLEVTVSLFIFSIVALIVLNALRSTQNTESILLHKQNQLNQLNRAIDHFSDDLFSIIKRNVMDASGHRLPVIVNNKNYLEFTHVTAHHSLEHVAYLLKDNDWYRKNWLVLDRENESQYKQRKLLSHINGIQYHFYDNNRNVYPAWPPVYGLRNELPAAIEIIITLKGEGSLHRLFILKGMTDASS